jgi:SAM-dependent methyltransferase
MKLSGSIKKPSLLTGVPVKDNRGIDMTFSVFTQAYANAYDLFYRDKDYQWECDLLEKVFQCYGTVPMNHLLDLGCGTGGHALPLALRGYQVVGVDRSADMLRRAEDKAASFPELHLQGRLAFHLGDLRHVQLDQQFDAVLMMFAVLSYQLSNEEVQAALQTVNRHLRPGGLFVADVWYGPAVLATRPTERTKVIATEDGKVIRAATPSVDVMRHLAQVHYHFWQIKGQQVVMEGEETHQVRFFFPQELGLFLSQAHLTLLHLSAFGALEQPPQENTWNVLLVAKSSP